MVNGNIQFGKRGAPTRRLIQSIDRREVEELAQADIGSVGSSQPQQLVQPQRTQLSQKTQEGIAVVQAEQDRLRGVTISLQNNIDRLASIPRRTQGETDTLFKNETDLAVTRQQIKFLEKVKGSTEVEKRGGDIRPFLVRRLGSIQSQQETLQSLTKRRLKDPNRPFQRTKRIPQRPDSETKLKPTTTPPLLPPGSIGSGARGGFLFEENGQVVERFQTIAPREDIMQQSQIQSFGVQLDLEPSRPSQDIPNENNIDFLVPTQRPVGVISPAPTIKEQFSKATAGWKLPIRGSLFFIGEKFQGFITQSELKGRSQSLGATGLVSTTTQTAPFFTPVGPALAFGFGVEQFTPAGIKQAEATGVKLEEDLGIPKEIGTLGTLGVGGFIGVGGATSTLGQVNRALNFPISEVRTLGITTKIKPIKTSIPKITDEPKGIIVDVKSISQVTVKPGLLRTEQVSIVQAESRALVKEVELEEFVTKSISRGVSTRLKSVELPSGKIIKSQPQEFQAITVGRGKKLEVGLDLVAQERNIIKAVSTKAKGFSLTELTAISPVERTTTLTIGRGLKGVKQRKALEDETFITSQSLGLESKDLLTIASISKALQRTDKGFRILERGRQASESFIKLKPPQSPSDIVNQGFTKSVRAGRSDLLKFLFEKQSSKIAKAVTLPKPSKITRITKPLSSLGITKNKLLGEGLPTIVGGRGATSKFSGGLVESEISLGPLSLSKPSSSELNLIKETGLLKVAPLIKDAQSFRSRNILKELGRLEERQLIKQRPSQKEVVREIPRERLRTRTLIKQALKEFGRSGIPKEPILTFKPLVLTPIIPPIKFKKGKGKKKKKAKRGRDDLVISEGFTARILKFKPIIITEKNLQQELKRFRGIGTRPAPILRLGKNNRRIDNGIR